MYIPSYWPVYCHMYDTQTKLRAVVAKELDCQAVWTAAKISLRKEGSFVVNWAQGWEYLLLNMVCV